MSFARPNEEPPSSGKHLSIKQCASHLARARTQILRRSARAPYLAQRTHSPAPGESGRLYRVLYCAVSFYMCASEKIRESQQQQQQVFFRWLCSWPERASH